MSNTLKQPAPIDQPVLPPGWVPFDTAAPAGLAHRAYAAAQRQSGTASHARHHGAAHSPHAQSLANHHALAHPHHAAATRHRLPGGRHRSTTLKHATRSHAQGPVRYSNFRAELGTMVSVNAGANQASVLLYGSQASVIGPLPLGRGLASVAAVGQSAMVVFLDTANPNDAMIVAVY